jgi:hypothetical protein
MEASYLTRSQFREWRSKFRVNPSAEKDEEKESATASRGGVPHAKRLSEIGHLPVVLASQAVAENLIDSHDVAMGIGLSQTLQQRAFSLASRRFEAALS